MANYTIVISVAVYSEQGQDPTYEASVTSGNNITVVAGDTVTFQRTSGPATPQMSITGLDIFTDNSNAALNTNGATVTRTVATGAAVTDTITANLVIGLDDSIFITRQSGFVAPSLADADDVTLVLSELGSNLSITLSPTDTDEAYSIKTTEIPSLNIGDQVSTNLDVYQNYGGRLSDQGETTEYSTDATFVIAAADLPTAVEGSKNYYIYSYRFSSGNGEQIYYYSGSFTITVDSSPSYSVTGPSSISENNANNTFTVSAVNVADGTQLYWSIDSATTADFVAVSGSTTQVSSESATFAIAAKADAITENNEIYTLRVRTGSTTGTIVASRNFTVTDTSTATGSYDHIINVYGVFEPEGNGRITMFMEPFGGISVEAGQTVAFILNVGGIGDTTSADIVIPSSLFTNSNNFSLNGNGDTVVRTVKDGFNLTYSAGATTTSAPPQVVVFDDNISIARTNGYTAPNDIQLGTDPGTASSSVSIQVSGTPVGTGVTVEVSDDGGANWSSNGTAFTFTRNVAKTMYTRGYVTADPTIISPTITKPLTASYLPTNTSSVTISSFAGWGPTLTTSYNFAFSGGQAGHDYSLVFYNTSTQVASVANATSGNLTVANANLPGQGDTAWYSVRAKRRADAGGSGSDVQLTGDHVYLWRRFLQPSVTVSDGGEASPDVSINVTITDNSGLDPAPNVLYTRRRVDPDTGVAGDEYYDNASSQTFSGNGLYSTGYTQPRSFPSTVQYRHNAYLQRTEPTNPTNANTPGLPKWTNSYSTNSAVYSPGFLAPDTSVDTIADVNITGTSTADVNLSIKNGATHTTYAVFADGGSTALDTVVGSGSATAATLTIPAANLPSSGNSADFYLYGKRSEATGGDDQYDALASPNNVVVVSRGPVNVITSFEPAQLEYVEDSGTQDIVFTFSIAEATQSTYYWKLVRVSGTNEGEFSASQGTTTASNPTFTATIASNTIDETGSQGETFVARIYTNSARTVQVGPDSTSFTLFDNDTAFAISNVTTPIAWDATSATVDVTNNGQSGLQPNSRIQNITRDVTAYNIGDLPNPATTATETYTLVNAALPAQGVTETFELQVATGQLDAQDNPIRLPAGQFTIERSTANTTPTIVFSTPPAASTVDPGEVVIGSFTVSNLDVAITLSVSGGTISTAIDGTYSTSISNAGNGTYYVKVTASSTYGGTATATIASTDWVITTRDAAGDPVVSMPAGEIVQPSTTVVRAFTVSGLETTITLEETADGTISTAIDGTFANSISNAGNGTYYVKLTSSATYGAQKTATVGGVSWILTTRSAVSAFDLGDVPDRILDTPTYSNVIVVGGTEIDVPISISTTNSPQYNIDGGEFQTAAGTVSPGQEVQVLMNSAPTYETTRNATLNIGGETDVFSVTTTTDTGPPPSGDYGLEVYDSNENLRISLSSSPVSEGLFQNNISVLYGASTLPYSTPGIDSTWTVISFGRFEDGGDGVYGPIDYSINNSNQTVTFTNNGYTNNEGTFEYDWVGFAIAYRTGI